MSHYNHRISVRINPRVRKGLDMLLKRQEYANDSEMLRIAVKDFLIKNDAWLELEDLVSSTTKET